MDDVVKLYWDLRSISECNGNDIAQTLSVAPHEHPAGFFGMVFNNITLTLELLDFYKSLWDRLTATNSSNLEQTKTQNSQRVIMIQKMSFIEIMSSFEFCAKRIVANSPTILGSISGRIYLSGIMQKSFERNLFGQDKLVLWSGVIRLRNSLVHNNGISEETACYHFPEITVTTNKDKMTQGNLRQFGLITKWLLNESKQWILKSYN